MFRIPLNPPDFRDPAAIQRHVLFSRAWASIILEKVPDRSRLLCGALTTSDQFPDLRVFVIVYRTGSQIDREKVICAHALQEVVQDYRPTDELAARAIRETRYFRQPSAASGGAADIEDAMNILNAAFPLIYARGSLLHILTSLEVKALQAVEVSDFRAWIESQRTPERVMLEAVPRCLSRDELDAPPAAPRERSESAILPAGEIKLSRSPAGPLPAGPLRHAVIVSLPGGPLGAAVMPEVYTHYCNREHLFTIGDEASRPVQVTVRTRCMETALFGLDAWALIGCDRSDCVSEPVEKAVTAAIARDPEVLDFARDGADPATPRGPYLVTIQ
jgi:hypothetical protein